MMTTRTENALAAVEQLTEMIRMSYVAAFAPGDGDFGVFSNVTRLSFGCDPVNTTVIETLQKLTRAYEGNPEDRGKACEARDALLALRNAAAALIGDIERDLDALTIGLTAGEARRALNEYANDYQPLLNDQPIEKG
jgi:hypothetical protein